MKNITIFLFALITHNVCFSQNKTIKLNDNGPAVKIWQQFLVTQGYLKSPFSISEFDRTTQNATEEFQKKNSLKADGVVGPGTYKLAITKGYSNTATIALQPLKVSLVLPDTTTSLIALTPKVPQKQLYAISLILNVNQLPDPIPDSDTIEIQLITLYAPFTMPTLTKSCFVLKKKKILSKDVNDTIICPIEIESNSVDSLPKEELIAIKILGDDSHQQLIKFVTNSNKTKDVVKPTIRLIPNSKEIAPYYDDAKTPKKDTIFAKFKLTGTWNEKSDTIHAFIDSSTPNKPRLVNSISIIEKDTWDKAVQGFDNGIITIPFIVETKHIVDTGTATSAFGKFMIKEDTVDTIGVWMTEKANLLWYNRSNFFVGSFIKTISGSSAQSELLDILVKVNLSSHNDLRQGKNMWFGLWGADAGLIADTSKKGIPLNEAMANVNLALNRVTDDKTQRVGFIGGGFKQFFGNAYFGGHIGILAIGGPLKHSYIMTGFYNSPWIQRLDSLTYGKDSVNGVINNYRNNLYFEAALNAFGDNIPSAMKAIRLKFGLMLPIARRDYATPTNKDFQYRLAVEVPIGGPIRW